MLKTGTNYIWLYPLIYHQFQNELCLDHFIISLRRQLIQINENHVTDDRHGGNYK
jgi:hypothetical protein